MSEIVLHADLDVDRFLGMSMRRHQQVLMYPFCEDLSEFESTLEVVHIFIDVLKGATYRLVRP